MESIKKEIDILLYRHPFKSEREDLHMEVSSFTELLRKLSLPENGNYYILDGDTKVEDYSEAPSGEKVYIRVVPTGSGGDYADTGKDMMLGGGALVLAGILVTVATWGTGAGFGGSLIVSGLTTLGGGYYVYTLDVDSSGTSSDTADSFSGTSNEDRTGSKVPVVLGRHLLYPWYAGLPYTQTLDIPEPEYTTIGSQSLYAVEDMSDTDEQYLNMLLGNSYATETIHMDSIQIDDTDITEYLDDDETIDDIIDFQESSALPEFYDTRIEQVDVGTAIDREDDDDPEEYTYTTSTDTYRADFTFTFSSGLYKSSDGDKKAISMNIYAFWKGSDEEDTEYQPVYGDTDDDGRIFVGDNLSTTCRFLVSKTFDNLSETDSEEWREDRQYTFKFYRTTTDDADRDSDDTYNTTCYLENYKSYTGTFDEDEGTMETYPILPSAQAKLNICSLQILATDQISGTLSNLNYEASQHMPDYIGDSSLGEYGPDYWEYGETRNPASAFLYMLMDSYVNKDPVEEADLENRIDYESLVTWYEFCDTWDLQCNAYIVDDVTTEETLANICSTAFASWNVVDNKYTIYIDQQNDTITQVFTPRNSWDFTGSKEFNDNPDGLEISYINSYRDDEEWSESSDGGFEDSVRYVYADYSSGDYDVDEYPNDYDDIDSMEVFWSYDSYSGLETW